MKCKASNDLLNMEWVLGSPGGPRAGFCHVVKEGSGAAEAVGLIIRPVVGVGRPGVEGTELRVSMPRAALDDYGPAIF